MLWNSSEAGLALRLIIHLIYAEDIGAIALRNHIVARTLLSFAIAYSTALGGVSILALADEVAGAVAADS
ncbi:MAG: hypothetical protein IKG18_00255 [Atopobiaceae bacterium]|nr:hypothetical protein [Atopobiaceae bacterium]